MKEFSFVNDSQAGLRRECGKLEAALHEVKRVLRQILVGCISGVASTIAKRR